MNDHGLYIYSKCKLSPITLSELEAYSFYAINALTSIAKSALIGEFNHTFIWENTQEQRELLLGSNLWKTLKFMWDYAENGEHYSELHDGLIVDLIHDLYLWSAACGSRLALDGSFGYESIEVREAGIKLGYKYLARLKLDFGCELVKDIPIHAQYPQSHEEALSTIEYALLSGFSVVGAVRNEIMDKSDPLIATKQGKVSFIDVDSAKPRILKKRKFTPTFGVNYDC
ncbi:hypothetical protein AB3A40_001805 [Vibrio alginolyticus]